MNNAVGPNTYLDFNGLNRLRAQAQRDERAALGQAAQQFEAYFLQEVLKSMRATVENGGLVDSSAIDTTQQMMDKEVAQHLSKGQGVGLARMLVTQFDRQLSTQEQLAQRPGAAFDLKAAPKALPLQPQGGLPLPTDPVRRSLK